MKMDVRGDRFDLNERVYFKHPLCVMGLHKWSDWEFKEKVIVVNEPAGGTRVESWDATWNGHYVPQNLVKRSCSRCPKSVEKIEA